VFFLEISLFVWNGQLQTQTALGTLAAVDESDKPTRGGAGGGVIPRNLFPHEAPPPVNAREAGREQIPHEAPPSRERGS
jgi:hypothetical protein